MRSIMHFYAESFHASLERLRRPELAGKPVVVTHSSGRGEFVVSASREAAAEGVRESITARHAGRYCPDAIFLPANWAMYREASDTVMDILSNFSPLLEPQSLDGAYMDVTGCFSLFGSPRSMAAEIRRRVAKEVGVRVSVGIARSKLVSSAASSAAKPDGCLEVRPGSEVEFLKPLPVGCLWGVGPKIEKRLLNLGVRTIGELAAIPERLLMRQFGALGSRLHRLSLGIDYSPVMALYPPAMVSIEHTFEHVGENLCEPGLVEPYLLWMCDRLAMKLRKRSQQASVVAIGLEFEGFPEISRSYTLKTPVSTAHGIYTGARRILSSEMQGARIRAIKLTLSGLESGEGLQLSFIGDTGRRMKLDAVLESIRARFGEHAIASGSQYSITPILHSAYLSDK
ncbi:MAG TPA: DNA polymerase IV [Armatimonadota bacterium]|nr:DNA polymerase IV [Armatimonadota bacterium]